MILLKKNPDVNFQHDRMRNSTDPLPSKTGEIKTRKQNKTKRHLKSLETAIKANSQMKKHPVKKIYENSTTKVRVYGS